MAQEQKVNSLIINELESFEVYDYLKDNGLINNDEVYVLKVEEMNDTFKELGELIDEKAEKEHFHDDLYYTEDEVDNKLTELGDNVITYVDNCDDKYELMLSSFVEATEEDVNTLFT